MSAISAGMLIYAACVEMLAGDFVMDAHLWRSSIRRQALASGSLFAGVIAMAAIGCVPSLLGINVIADRPVSWRTSCLWQTVSTFMLRR